MAIQIKREKGQAILMATFSLVAMCGMMGLAVDLGWSYFTRRAAQTAADAAAQAAAQSTLDTVGQVTAIGCSGGQTTCQDTPMACDASGNLTVGCLYAEQHGFRVGGRQNVTIAAGNTLPVPTAPGVTVDYWVTVRATEAIPQLFSAVLGNSVGNISARATAAIVNAQVEAQLIALNRENDSVPGSKKGSTGNDVSMQGGDTITVSGAASLASTDSLAGDLGGSATVTAPATYIRGSGGYGSTSNWVAAPQTGLPDGSMFMDPMQGKGQPPAPQGLTDHPTINGYIADNSVLPSGNYYAVDVNGKPTGAGLTFGTNVTFQDGNFGNYVIFGGIQGDVNFGPGRYIFAGSTTGTTLYWNKVYVTDQTPLDANGNVVPPTDAGELFVITDPNYPGLQIPAALQSKPAVLNNLVAGDVEIKSGNSDQWSINLHGLNPNDPALPAELKPFAPTLFWQDQANTAIKYNADGSIDTSCGSLDSPCTNGKLKNSDSTYWTIDARPNIQLWGTSYQPRGAGIVFQGHGAFSAPIQLITGYVSLQGGANITLAKFNAPLRRRMVALIE